MGDANRDSVMLRGKSIGVWVANVVSYGPMPEIISSDCWAILVNSTYKQKFDIGKTNEDLLTIYVGGGEPDFFLFTANDMRDTLSALTDVTGKPVMLPAFGYGLTFVENEQATNAKELLNDIRTFRDRKIPCDIIGLEPLWMGGYDYSVDKKWDKERFYIPYWLPKNTASHRTFLGPIRFMGMNLSLWLCENYDLFYEEERNAKALESDNLEIDDIQDAFNRNVDFIDEHLVKSDKIDLITKPDEPWFEHLKKFVDNGAQCFKLDGASQVLEHPDRLWAKKFFDAEVHNAYPVVLSKQMKEGFTNHTDRRAMIYTSGSYVGIQQYAATWAGDTGGGPRTLVSCLNHAMCGHTNTTCDMDIMNPLAIHYAFLSTWTQICSWAYYFHPWFLPEKNETLIRDYANLRSSLFPYIYSTAHYASQTGIPVVRPLPLMYDTDKFDNTLNAYMLGDNLFVGAFDMNITLPDGEWIDYFTDKVYSGSFEYEIPDGKAGALFVKKGSIIPTMTPQQYIMEKEHDYRLEVYPGANASFDLYEDDNYTYDYLDGKFAVTKIELFDNGDKFILKINKRQGDFEGRPNNGHDPLTTSIPKINGILPIRDLKIKIHSKIKSVKIDDKKVDFTYENGITEFILPKEYHEKQDAVYQVEI